MKIALTWLSQYISLPETPEQISQSLTSTGLEVETVEKFQTVPGGLEGLVIGQVLTCTKHPNADKLSLTTVHVGNDTILPIVCGASNVAAGQKVIVALPGSTLYPTKGEPFTIKSAKIRGEVSEGMICAEDEIGLGQSHAGIIVLPNDTKVGTKASEYFKIENDYVFEIGLTPNRVDAASHIGVARDLAAAKRTKVTWPDVSNFKEGKNNSIQVEVLNPEACVRYSGLVIENLHVKESPEWLKNKLKAIGLSPINNVVDITNFICHEMGQPMHAFDLSAITSKKVSVRTLPQNTHFTTLDGKERKLSAQDLMICNDTEPMCLAGVFGGLHSGVKESTTSVFLESATFAADYVRKTSQFHGIKTDSSFRFERGTDPNLPVYALKRAALLLAEICGGTVTSPIIDVYPQPISHTKIIVKDKNINRLLGKALTRNEVKEILQHLEINIEEEKQESFVAVVPPYRVDVKQEADIAEEVLRIYGFNNIELKPYASSDFISSFPAKDINKFRNTLASQLVSNGFYEIWTNSLTNQAYQQRNNIAFGNEPVEILNKLSEEQGILRQTLLFTGLEVCAFNINRKQKDLKLFEFGKIYGKQNGNYSEKEKLALFISGNEQAESWQTQEKPTSHFTLAQSVNEVLQKSAIKEVILQQSELPYFENGVDVIFQKRTIASFGKVQPNVAKDLGIKQTVFYAEIDFETLFEQSNPHTSLREIPKFPEVRRDLSLVLDQNHTFEQVQQVAKEIGKEYLKNVNLFDVYQGDKLEEGKKAYALSFILQDENKTMTDSEIDTLMNKLIHAYENKLGAGIRK
ncbi:MAG: phenylalanine--tRNA ligase subunit beta [Cyclobacteriaceae bacterium]|jgi:phenylalanyl-tRNA synthetase beta chain|nr:phenylalanine--tRNA ligase subunit beta [Cytophagales bacterium]MCZ8329574.1 phenylalanine--tRNA ligase subunit beta [Cyclobacteriaceae bacterium]